MGCLTGVECQLQLPYKLAIAYNIKLIFYGEDGEVEYGGSKEQKIKQYFVQYQKDIYRKIYNKVINNKFKKKAVLHIQMTQKFYQM